MEVKKLFELALIEQKKRNFLSAEKLYKKILENYPNEISTLNNLGTSLKELGKDEEAIFYYEKALELKPEDIITNFNLGIVFSKLEDFQKSIIFYEKIIKIDPKHFQSYKHLMDIYEKTNNHKKLEVIITKAKSYLKNNSIIKLYEGILLFKKEKFNEAIKNLEMISFDSNEIKQEILRVLTLGKLYDKTKNFDKAFNSFLKANEINFNLKSKNINKNFYLENINIRKQFFGNLKKEEWSSLKLPNLQNNPIFMVGFPRSGTTLLDNILNSHPLIEVIEEKSTVPKLIGSLNQLTNNNLNNLKNINVEQIQKLRNNYFEDLHSHVKSKNNLKIYIDKLPLNIIYVGEIFKIFPKAKFIFSVRHPCDCVLSCFMQNFAINNAMANFFNLEDSAKLYNFVMELWSTYISIFQIKYHEVKYENLVKNLETTSKQLLKFLELPWNDNVLKFFETAKEKKQIKTPSYDQVIKPIYSDSTGRWKMYKKQISMSFEILEPWIKKFKYK